MRGRKTLEGARILAVGHDEAMLDHVAEVLGRSGATVDRAAYAGEALMTHAATVPDVLLVDMDLDGGKDGLALVKRVRELPVAKGGQVPAATTDAEPLDNRKEAWSRAGCQGHITKPIDEGELVALVGSLRGRPAERRKPKKRGLPSFRTQPEPEGGTRVG